MKHFHAMVGKDSDGEAQREGERDEGRRSANGAQETEDRRRRQRTGDRAEDRRQRQRTGDRDRGPETTPNLEPAVLW